MDPGEDASGGPALGAEGRSTGETMNRRRFLAYLGTAAVSTTAGCPSGGDDRTDTAAGATASPTDTAAPPTDRDPTPEPTATRRPTTTREGPTETATDTATPTESRSGSVRMTFGTGGEILSSPTAVSGTVYVGATDGTLYGVSMASDASSSGSRVRLRTLGHHDG